MKYIYTLLIALLAFSCSDNDPEFNIQNVDYTEINETEIVNYITDNNLSTEKTASGLYYIITEEGDGNIPLVNSNVTVAYKGYFLDGTIFDQSENATFDLTNLIAGFREGTLLLKEGGSGTFILPSRLAYGNQGSGTIAPGDVIAFDIELIQIN